jgi:outer membrane protein
MRKIFFCLFVIPFFAFGQNVLTPEEAVRIALENNYSIRIARNNLEIAENNAGPGAAGFFPSVTADGAYTRSRISTRQEFFDGRIIDQDNAGSENLNAAVTLNWVIFDGLGMFSSLDRYNELRNMGELSLRNEIEFSIADIYSAYFNIVRLQRILELLEYNISISEERLRIERDKKEVGSGSGFDMRRAEVDLNEDRVSFLREELRLLQTKLLLNNLLGIDSETDFAVIDTIILQREFNLDELLDLTQSNNSTLQLAAAGRNVSELDARIAKSDLFPTLSLNGGYNFLKSEAEAGFTRSNQSHGYSYGVRASWNIFNGLNTRRNIENASILIENSRIQYEQSFDRVISDLRNSFRVYEVSMQQIKLELQNLKSAEENVDIALERLKLGNISPLEFREAQINLLNAQNRLISAQVEAKIAETELLRLSGTLVSQAQD